MESKQTIKLHCLENRVASGYVTFGSYWEKGTLVIPNFKNDVMDSFVLRNENKKSIPEPQVQTDLTTETTEAVSDAEDQTPVEPTHIITPTEHTDGIFFGE